MTKNLIKNLNKNIKYFWNSKNKKDLKQSSMSIIIFVCNIYKNR